MNYPRRLFVAVCGIVLIIVGGNIVHFVFGSVQSEAVLAAIASFLLLDRLKVF